MAHRLVYVERLNVDKGTLRIMSHHYNLAMHSHLKHATLWFLCVQSDLERWYFFKHTRSNLVGAGLEYGSLFAI